MRKLFWRLQPVLLALLFVTGLGVTAQSTRADVSVGIAVTIAPPDLPVYAQPPCPGEDYIWTPGYWAWDGYDYYWVPGTWVLAPQPGFFWTPGYWAWRDGAYFWSAGYWGPVVGFYGGIDYGYGYFGRGYEGGRWDRGHFYYNRAVSNVNVTVIRNTYNTTVVNRTVTVNRVSFNGCRGGVDARATAQEESVARERHVAMVAAQTRHVEDARKDQQLRASRNHGLPPVAATDKPGDFKGRNVVRASRAGAVHSNERPANVPPNAARPNPNPPGHVRDLPPATRGNAPNTGNAKIDKKYAEQQQKLAQKQAQDRQKLEQKQQREDQKIQQQRINDAKRQQMEQRHQQETQKLVRKQQQQNQKMQQKQAPRPSPKPAPKPTEHPH